MSEETRICDDSVESEEGDAEPFLEDSDNSRELLERLRELEAENSSLALANESQREAYERCLDEVANHVVQALLNQKDLREECIKLKMRVFDLERQNRALAELLTQTLHGQVSTQQQASPGPQLEPCPDSLLTGLDRPSESQHETPTKSQSTDSTLGTQGATISMEALSPFFKKRAHILEVLRCLEETDPLKFHPSAGLPSCCRFSPVLLPAEPGVASHACMDSDVLAVMNSEGHRVPCESCQSCLLVSQRNLHIASKFHQANSAWQPNAEGQLGDHGASSSQTIQPPPGSTNKPCTALAEESDLSIDHRYENAGDPSHGINTGAYLYSIIKDVAQNFPSSERSEQLKGGAPHVEGHCEKLSGVTLGMQCTPQPSEMDSLPLKHMNTAAIQSLTAGHIPDRCCFKMASEVAKMKTCLYTSTSYQTDHQARLQICSGLHQSSSVDTRLKNMIVDACGPSPGNSTVSSPGKIGLALTPTSISYLSEGKASPISSPSRLLSFLKIPSMGERVQVASPLRLSPQLTRSSKIPCRNNNYEICHSALVAQRAPGTEREMPSSSSKTNTYPAAHSAPASPPKADDVCSSVAKNFAFNSLSAPKGSCDAKLKPAQGNIQKDPRYENIAGLSALGYVEGPSQHLQVPPYPGQASEKPLSSVKDTFPSTGSSPGLESSIQDTYAESTVWYQVQGHHSLPNSSVFHKSQSSCVFSSVKEKTPDRETVQSPSVGPARVRPKRGHLPATSKKHAVGQCQGEAGHLPFKERLAALGKLRIADDLPAATRHVDRRHARCSNIKAAGPCTNEKSRTAERQADRTSSEHRHTKYTGSLDGKSYPRASPSGCALKSLGPCLPCEPGAKSLSLNSASSRPVLETFSSRVHMTEGSKIRPGMMPSNTEAPHMKTTAFHGVPLTARTAASSQSSPAKVSSKSPSRPGQASSCPRGCKPAHDDRGSSQRQPPRLEDRGRLTGGKKKNPPLPARPPDLSEDRRPFVPGSRSAIEQKVMKGIEENMLKLQDQSRGQSVELKQKASNGIASWFGLRKSKLPALSRKADMSKSKEDKKEWKLNVSAPGKDPKSATKKKLEVESLNISKLMEKAEDLRRALEEERAFMNGVALERPVRGHSCEVGRDQAQGQLSVMYRGVSPDNFMQQLLNRVDERGAGPFGLAHRRLSFDSKRSRPVFSHQRKDGIPHTKSSEDMEKGSDMVRKSEVTSDESLAEFVTSQRFAGSGATHTLDSGIGTFPLPMLEISRQKPRPEGDTPACSGRPGTKVSRKARTLDRALSSLEEAPHRDSMPALCGSALEESASTAALSSTIAGDVASLPSKNWTFPNLKAPVGQAEVFLDIREEVELAVSEGVELGVSEWVELGVSEGVELTTHGSPLRQILKPCGPPGPAEAEAPSLFLPPRQAQGPPGQRSDFQGPKGGQGGWAGAGQ